LPDSCPRMVSNWSWVHVHRLVNIEDQLIEIDSVDIETKAIIVLDIIMSVPLGTLTEH
jgi:hypothetical protein